MWIFVLVGPSLVLWLVGAQPWTPPSTPDSEFYFSLDLFGSDVTDRAPTPAYYWTRLGSILPSHALIELLGPDWGFAVWRWVLLSIIATPLFFLIVKIAGARVAVPATLVAVTNAVMLTTLGNPYVSSVVLPLLTAVIATTALAFTRDDLGARSLLLAGSGSLVGWTVMVNTIAGAYAALGLLATAGVGIVVRRGSRWIWSVAAGAAASVIGAAVSIGVFLAWGRITFPALDWLEVVKYYSQVLNAASYRDSSLAWLNPNPVLLVPIVVLATAAAILIAGRYGYPADPLRRYALIVVVSTSTASMALACVQEFHFQSAILQVFTYRSFLWAPVLVGLSVVIALVLAPALTGPLIRTAAATGALVIAASVSGRITPPFHTVLWSGVVVAAACVVALVAAWCVRAEDGQPARPLATITAIGLSAIAVMGVQLLPNASQTKIPYTSGFVRMPEVDQYTANERAARWVLHGTPAGSRLMVWSYPEERFTSAAAMNLWGPNAISHGKQLASRGDAEVLRSVSATTLALYGPNRASISSYLTSLNRFVGARVTRCTTIGGADSLHVCLAPITNRRAE